MKLDCSRASTTLSRISRSQWQVENVDVEISFARPRALGAKVGGARHENKPEMASSTDGVPSAFVRAKQAIFGHCRKDCASFRAVHVEQFIDVEAGAVLSDRLRSSPV